MVKVRVLIVANGAKIRIIIFKMHLRRQLIESCTTYKMFVIRLTGRATMQRMMHVASHRRDGTTCIPTLSPLTDAPSGRHSWSVTRVTLICLMPHCYTRHTVGRHTCHLVLSH